MRSRPQARRGVSSTVRGARVAWLIAAAVAALVAALYLGPLSGPLNAAAADTITLALSPPSIVANGTSTSTATATVTFAGVPVDGETVTITSSGTQHVSAVTPGPGSGQYQATITSTTTPGTPTITATDTTATPAPISAQATLTQTPGPAAHVTVGLAPASIPANGSSTSTATATVTDANGNPVAGNHVTFTPAPVGSVIDHGDGTYTATIRSTTTPGPVTVTATDTTPTPNVSGSATLTQTVGPATHVTVVLSQSSIAANGGTTTTATATVTDASGIAVTGDSVVFSASPTGVTIGSTTNNHNGTYTATITSSKVAGTVTITATDTTPTPNVSGQATLTQTPAAAHNVTVVLSPTSIVANGSATSTATATVTDINGNAIPTDTVVFSASPTGVTIGPTTNNHNGTYTATITSSKVAGPVSITASDTSATPNATGTTTLTQTGGPPTSITLQLSPTAIVANGSSHTTATATVTDASGNAIAGNAVTFSSTDPGDGIGPVTDNGNGSYSATITSSTTAGSPTITATDITATPGISAQATLTQAAGSTTTVLAVSPTPVATNQTATLIATVQASVGSPAGTVTFQAGGTAIASCANRATTPTGSIATVTCSTSFDAAHSPEQLSAVFSPSGRLVGSTSSVVALAVTPASTATAVHLSVIRVRIRKSVTYRATVTPVYAGGALPSGTVSFYADRTLMRACAKQPLTAGSASPTASCTTTYRIAGKHLITARYGGDTNFVASTSPRDALTVTGAPAAGGIPSVLTTMRWTFLHTPTYSKVLSLLVSRPPAGGQIVIACGGRRCHFKRVVIAIHKLVKCPKGAGSRCTAQPSPVLSLTGRLRNDRLVVGTTLVIEVVKAHWIGKYYAFTIGASGPLVQIDCLAPGASSPRANC